MSSSKVLLGFLAGAAVGSILGILYAPEHGVETRRKLLESGNDLTDSLKSKANDFVGSMKDTYQDMKDTVADTYQDAKSKTQDLADKGAAKLNTFKGEAKNEAKNQGL